LMMGSILNQPKKQRFVVVSGLFRGYYWPSVNSCFQSRWNFERSGGHLFKKIKDSSLQGDTLGSWTTSGKRTPSFGWLASAIFNGV
jgi:hypothetical protein